MKHVTLNSGPFHKWSFFKPQEIETTAVDDLRSYKLLPSRPAEVNLDSLVQDLFHFTPTYGKPGKNMLGRICFSPTRIEKIILEESLGDLDAGSTVEHRRRSTLAHEIGHGRLHRDAFTALAQARQCGRPNTWVRYPRAVPVHANFSGDMSDQTCPPDTLDTWERMAEWQANRYMAAVLTPEHLVRRVAQDWLTISDASGAVRITGVQREALASELSRIFNVSRRFATIRVDTLFPSPASQVLPFSITFTIPSNQEKCAC